MKSYHVGQKVTWNSESGYAKGTITKIHTKPFQVSGKDGTKYTKHASKDHPMYEIKSNISDHIAYHFAETLHTTKFPNGGKMDTKPPFEEYFKTIPEYKNDTSNYNLRAAYENLPYQEMVNFATNPEGHLPDTYKLPNHPTFSNESIYFNPYGTAQPNINQAGYWDNNTYIPYNPAVKDTVVEHNNGGPLLNANIKAMKYIDISPIMENFPEAKSGIHINPAHKGKFTALKKRTGKTTEELTHSKNPTTRKEAIFAQNAKHFHHGENGYELQPLEGQFQPNFQNLQPQIPNYIDPNGAPDLGYSSPFNLLPNINPLEAANVGLSAVNHFIPENREQLRYHLPQEYSQHPNGTGSTALFEEGGKFPTGGKLNDNQLFNRYYTQFEKNGYDDPSRLANIMVLSQKYNVPPDHIFTTSHHPIEGTQLSRRDYSIFGDDPNKPIASLSEEIAGTYAGSNNIQAPALASSYTSGGGLSRSSDYGSKKHPYAEVPSNDFAGPHRSYPIPTIHDAVDALRLAGMHHDHAVIARVYKKYPSLKKGENGLKLMDGTYDLSPEQISTYRKMGYNIEEL